eukprot:Skav206715  [mRNA]  locus=scaffold3267:66914:71584:+ [translate_table: standard]
MTGKYLLLNFSFLFIRVSERHAKLLEIDRSNGPYSRASTVVLFPGLDAKIDPKSVVQIRFQNADAPKPFKCFLSQELFRRAIEAADSCLKLDPQHVKALHRRSVAFEAIHSYAPALLDLQALQRRTISGTVSIALLYHVVPFREG